MCSRSGISDIKVRLLIYLVGVVGRRIDVQRQAPTIAKAADKWPIPAKRRRCTLVIRADVTQHVEVVGSKAETAAQGVGRTDEVIHVMRQHIGQKVLVDRRI